MRSRRRSFERSEELDNYWPSFTDLMAALALILFVLFLLAYIRNLLSARSLEGAQIQLAGVLQRLDASKRQIATSEGKLRMLEDDAKVTQEKLSQQERVIADSNRQLGDVRAQFESIAVLRVEVLDKVKRALQTELGAAPDASTPLVRVSDNGNIVLAESVLFDVNSSAIKESAKPLLRTLAKAFAGLLMDPAVRENIDSIEVQGHTDERGTTSFNRDLSAKRASAVLNYVFENDPVLEYDYGRYFAATGYSQFRPVNPAKTEAAYEQNRRIEISVVVKDANVRRVIDTYMQNQSPTARDVDGGS